MFLASVVDEVKFRELQKELQTDVQSAIRQNLEQFQAKFIIQQRQLEEIHHVFEAVVSGPHDKIRDQVYFIYCATLPDSDGEFKDINHIWEEMVCLRTVHVHAAFDGMDQRWRGSVKGRRFVLALRDHFREKFDRLKENKDNATPIEHSTGSQDSEEWTSDYIHITRVQPIMEAFDDDASGFVTVAEANAFADARPAKWR